MSPTPALYRIARALRRLSIVVAVALVLFVASAAVSGSEIRLGRGGSTGITTALIGNNTVAVHAGFNLSNPGVYPLTDLVLATQISFPNGTPLASGDSPMITVGPGATETVPLSVLIAVDTIASDPSLLTEDEKLPAEATASATYAYFVHVSVSDRTNLSWGAPFYGLTVTVGNPSVSGGNASVVVTVTFNDHASFGLSGDLVAAIDDASGGHCGGATLNVSVAAGGSYYDSQKVPVNTGCNPSGGEVVLRGESGGFDVALPPQRIP